jgi:hypothetical protein
MLRDEEKKRGVGVELSYGAVKTIGSGWYPIVAETFPIGTF